ncbi:TPA: Tn3 family transposase [Escherichia coli]|nr:Tn3 family transposase [Escherichia coli]
MNLKEIKIRWNEILRLATSIKQGTVTASLMLKKLASYPKQNGLASKRLVRTVLIFTESSDQFSRATDRVPGLPASPGYAQ